MGKFIIQRSKADRKKFYWTQTAANGEVLATSEIYESKRAAYNGAESAIKNAATAEIIDRT